MKVLLFFFLSGLLLTMPCYALGIGVTTQEIVLEKEASFLITNPNEEVLSFSVFSDGDLSIKPSQGVIAAGGFQEVIIEKQGVLPEYVFVQGRSNAMTVPALAIRVREAEEKGYTLVKFPWGIFVGMMLLALVISMIVLVLLRRR